MQHKKITPETIIENMNAQAKGYGTFRLDDQNLLCAKPDGSEVNVNFRALAKKGVKLYITEKGFSAETSKQAEKLMKEGHCIAITDKTLQTLQKALEQEKLEKQLKDIHLVYAGLTEDFGRVYRLSAHVPQEVWGRISEYFFYASEEDGLGGDADYEDLGWVTTNPGAVEEILQVRSELTIEAQRNRAEQKKQQRKELEQMKKEIIEAFRDAEKPDPKVEQPEYAEKFRPGSEKMLVEGERIDDPFYRQNLYGGGQWWIIQENYIWYVQNNGADGDDWSQNNVETGGAGAIGVRVPSSRDLEERIRKYAQR